MKNTRRGNGIVRLWESVQQRLNAYALGGSAAGVSLLALLQPAEGKIVYTPAHVVIGAPGNYKLDLNHDGKTAFTLSDQWGYGGTTLLGAICLSFLQGRQMRRRPTRSGQSINTPPPWILESASDQGSHSSPALDRWRGMRPKLILGPVGARGLTLRTVTSV